MCPRPARQLVLGAWITMRLGRRLQSPKTHGRCKQALTCGALTRGAVTLV